MEYFKSNYKCPTCFKSICDMTSYNEMLDQDIALVLFSFTQNPLPDEYKKEINIYCNDCEEKSKTDFHFFGNKVTVDVINSANCVTVTILHKFNL